MRGAEVIATRPESAHRDLSAALGVELGDAAALVSAMRSESVYGRVRAACKTRVLAEDLMLLCANPFDRVEPEELGDADVFVRCGLLQSMPEGDFAVNVDIALTCQPRSPLEFGFYATLLTRLDRDERNLIAAAFEIGPRPSAVDQILDIARAAQRRDRLMQHVAQLTEAQRVVVRDALALGDLPDDFERLRADGEVPMVTLDPGPAGRAGLVFWVTDPNRDDTSRPVVPLEMRALLPELLDAVPAAPEVERKRARARRTGSTARRAPRTEAVPEPPAAPEPAPAPFSRRPSDIAPTIGQVARTVQVSAASAVVDLHSGHVAGAARKDAELAASILEVVGDRLVVLRAGVDAADWAERCALRLGL